MAHRSTTPSDVTPSPSSPALAPVAPAAMPEVDWLTGLSSREAFGRAVNQADRDRDPMVVAALAVEDFPDLNRLCGYEAGDDLLRTLGRILADRTSVDVTAGRIGGNRFGLLWTPAGDQEPERWLAPIIAELRNAVRRWVAHQHGIGAPCPSTPNVTAGLSAGHAARTWLEAELALDLAGDRSGPPVVTFDADDPRVVHHRWRQRVVDDLVTALRDDRLTIIAGSVEPLGNGGGRWLRLGVSLTGAGRAEDRVGRGARCGPGAAHGVDPSRAVSSAAEAAPGLARDMERRLIERADEIVSGAQGLLRVTIPLVGPLAGRGSPLRRLAATLERGSAPPTRILFEIDQGRLLDGRGATDLREASGLLNEVGSGVVIGGYVGGWDAWRAIDGVGVAYLKPCRELVAAASDPRSAAARILAAVVENAGGADRQLVAPAGTLSDSQLAALGFHYVERPGRPLDDIG